MLRSTLLFLLLAGCGTASHSPTHGDSAPAGRGGATAEGGATAADFVDAPGVIRTLDVGGEAPLFVVYPDVEPTSRFCLAAEELPTELRRDGARVVFSGTREEIPADHRMACSPLDLREIERER